MRRKISRGINSLLFIEKEKRTQEEKAEKKLSIKQGKGRKRRKQQRSFGIGEKEVNKESRNEAEHRETTDEAVSGARDCLSLAYVS